MAKLSRKHTGKQTPFPKVIKPMLTTLTDKPFNKEDWVYELKWDGYRVLAMVEKSKVILRSREAQDYSSRYPVLVDALSALNKQVIIDGEVVVLDENGQPDFNELQRYNGSQPLVYYAFDLLWADGYSLLDIPLLERKAMLSEYINDNRIIKYSDHFHDGIELFAHVQALGLEGIIAKKKDSSYLPGNPAFAGT